MKGTVMMCDVHRRVAGVAVAAVVAAAGVAAGSVAWADSPASAGPSYEVTECGHVVQDDGTVSGFVAVEVSDPGEVGYDLVFHYGDLVSDEVYHGSGSQPWTMHFDRLNDDQVTDECSVDFTAHKPTVRPSTSSKPGASSATSVVTASGTPTVGVGTHGRSGRVAAESGRLEAGASSGAVDVDDRSGGALPRTGV
ncbi:hypothetical protein [Cutibacterium sp.]|uniref:hypothetical protein n=1 Tax=Cutibacterium sp. TaxID=1912221 RepID=UPI0026DAA17A|nr:hypothetical protein [Cutibacterium sp.]